MYDERIGQNPDVYSLGRGFNEPDLIFSSLYNLRMYVLAEIRKDVHRQKEMNFWAKKTVLNSERKPAKITYECRIVKQEHFFKIHVTEKWFTAKNVHVEYIPRRVFLGIKVTEDHIGKNEICSYCKEKAVGSFTESIPGGIFMAEVCKDCKKLVEEGKFGELP